MNISRQARITSDYWLHLQYEAGYDEHPVLRVYEKYLTKDGDLDPYTDDIADRYDFTDEDNKWLMEAFGEEYLDDLSGLDEWFGTNYPHYIERLLPPSAREYLKALPPYEYFVEQ